MFVPFGVGVAFVMDFIKEKGDAPRPFDGNGGCGAAAAIFGQFAV